MGYCSATAAASSGGDGDGEQHRRHCIVELHGGADTILNGSPVQNPQHAKYSHNNSLTAAEMESLAALCDTFLPSVAAATSGHSNFESSAATATAAFFQTSASAAGTPERVGGMISERVRHPKKWMVRLSLWMLSTWYGTYILCGNASLSNHFPYFQTFSKLSHNKREKIALSWSLSFFLLHRMFFRTIKILSLLAFFSQVDEKMNNISWKAIDYPGPDPQFKLETRQSEASNLNENGRSREEELYGPLFRGIVNIDQRRGVAAEALRKFGFPVAFLPPRTKTASPSMMIKCDAVVVGSGSGGGVVAFKWLTGN